MSMQNLLFIINRRKAQNCPAEKSSGISRKIITEIEKITNCSFLIVGIWISSNDGYYKRASKFLLDEAGYEFKSDGQFINRDNIGWCGTPPITYHNYIGRWKSIDEKTLTINSRHWQGPYTQTLQYQFIEDDKDIIKFLTLNYTAKRSSI